MSLILIVEDNPRNMKLVRDVLQVKGDATLEAMNAEDGIVLASERHPDLILMDIQLPGMNGIDALRVLRGNPVTATIPALAVTASVMQQDRRLIIEAGFDGYLGKPINLKETFWKRCAACSRKPDEERSGGPPRGKARARSAKPCDGRSGHKVLVVDDTPHNVKLLADLLAVKGYAVATAVNGEEALVKVASEQPDLVLLDVMMPSISGYDV